MTDFTLNQTVDQSGPIQPASRPNLDKGFNPLTMIIFFGDLAAGMLFVAYSIYVDVNATGTKVTTYLPFLQRRGRLRYRLAAAGRTDPPGRKRRRFRDGVRPLDRGDHLESRNLVFRPAGFQFAYPDRVDHRRRHCQCADARP